MSLRDKRKPLIPIAFILMGAWSVTQWNGLPFNAPELERHVANVVQEKAIKDNSNFIEADEIKRLSQLAVDIDDQRSAIEEIENRKSYIQKMLDKDNSDVKELKTTLEDVIKEHTEGQDKLAQLEKTHSKEFDKIVKGLDAQKSELKELKLAQKTQQNKVDQEKLQAKIDETKSLKEALEKLKDQLNESKDHNKDIAIDLDKAQDKIAGLSEEKNELKAVYCQQKDTISNLEEEMKALLKDKEIVANKVKDISSDKDSLLAKVDDLKDHVTKDDKKKEEDSKKDEDQADPSQMTALLSALTNLTQQLEMNSQILATQRSQMPSISSYFENLQNPMNQYHGFNTGPFQQPYSGAEMIHPRGKAQDFHGAYSFPMQRNYGSEQLGQISSMPVLDFSSVRNSYRGPTAQNSNEAGSTFFDFTSNQ